MKQRSANGEDQSGVFRGDYKNSKSRVIKLMHSHLKKLEEKLLAELPVQISPNRHPFDPEIPL